MRPKAPQLCKSNPGGPSSLELKPGACIVRLSEWKKNYEQRTKADEGLLGVPLGTVHAIWGADRVFAMCILAPCENLGLRDVGFGA